MTKVIHLSGVVIVDAETELTDAWIVDGHLELTKPAMRPSTTIEGYVLPGLVDVHSHIGLGDQGAVPPAVARAQAIADRDSGVLLVRDAGVPREPYSTEWMDHDDRMPRIIRCGRHIARPKRYIRHLSRDVEIEELPGVVAEEARAGDGWVKLVGDWIDRADGEQALLKTLWPVDALTEAVAQAHEAGARVTTHVFSAQGARDALDAGVDCIEHGTGMDQAMMNQAREQGTAVVPTMVQRGNFADIASAGAKFPAWAEEMMGLHAVRHEQARALFDTGVLLLAGTDQGTAIPHGSIAREAAALVEAGLPAPAVVEQLTWGTRDYLGVPGIADGASADVVVYERDPRDDIGVLAEPLHVILRGRRVAPNADAGPQEPIAWGDAARREATKASV